MDQSVCEAQEGRHHGWFKSYGLFQQLARLLLYISAHLIS